MSIVHVAVGLIFNHAEEILIALRSTSQHQGGLWEFPGGKVEARETVPVALARELMEEIGIEVIKCSPFVKVSHDYEDKQVLLDTYVVESFIGEAKGMEGQDVRWVALTELDQYELPDANKKIVEAIHSRHLN